MNSNIKVKSLTLTPFLFVLLLFISNVFAGDYNNEANFTQVYTDTLNGDISATGSSVICAKQKNKNKCDWNYGGYLFDINPLTMHDGNTTAFPKNSGGAKITMPANVKGSDIQWARLYWQGHIFGLENHSSDFTNAIKNKENVTMLDSKGNIHNLTANSSDVYYYGYDNKSVYGTEIKGYRYFYQASKDVTNIVKQSYDSAHNYFIVGNINTTMTKDTYFIKDTKLGVQVKWGNWGGWALIVVYKDPNDTTKNISLYDGFKFLLPPFGGTKSLQIDLPANSFYTPKYGTVKSKTIMFAAGAEKKIAADKLEMQKKNGTWATLSNGLNPADNQINDSITYLGNQINPTRIFNAGTDLDTYDTSGILDNAQTTTSLKVTMKANTSSADQAFVGFIGISNDIYKPNICYNETLYDSNNVKLNNNSVITVGDNIKVELLINNNDLETATNVQIIKNFDSNATSYDANSTTVKNIGNNNYTNQTDIFADDLTDFNSTSDSLRVRIGTGANNTQGGTFNPNDTGYLDFNTTLNTDQNISLTYDTSYIFSIAGKQFTVKGTLPKCTAFDNIIKGKFPVGAFNIVNQNFSGTAISADPNSEQNALYTQIAGKNFNINIISLQNDKTTLTTYNGDVNLSIIDTPNYIPNDAVGNQNLCDNAIPISGTIQTVTFNNEYSKSISLSYNKARKNVSFKIDFNYLGSTKHVCSIDTFAIRPASYKMDANTSTLIGGKNYTLDINASSLNGNLAEGYNENIQNNSTTKAYYDLNIPTGCMLPPMHNNLPLPLTFASNGQAIYPTFKYPNIGDINVTIYDNLWTQTDQNLYTSKGYDECIVDSNTTTANASGKIGCLIKSVKQFSFSPKEFQNILNIENYNNSNFTYISKNKNMSANLKFKITAILDDNSTATNYTANCYAKDINSTIALLNNPVNWLNGNPNALHRIIFFDDSNTTYLESNATATATFLTKDNNFTNGVANILTIFNFRRDSTKTDEPFNVMKNDFNISVINTNSITGNNFNRTIDKNTTFYYGRVHAPDYRFKGKSGNATIYYEVYSDQNKSVRNSFDINGSESIDSINWYINTLHNSSNEGNVTKYSSVDDVKFQNNTSNTTKSTTSSINQGNESINLTAPKTPYKDKIDMNSSSWLIYNPTDFQVEFQDDGKKWAGQGKLGHTIDTNISKRSNRRLNW